MESDNILAVNIPNLITITLMAIVGGVVLGLIGKAVRSARSGDGMSMAS